MKRAWHDPREPGLLQKGCCSGSGEMGRPSHSSLACVGRLGGTSCGRTLKGHCASRPALRNRGNGSGWEESTEPHAADSHPEARPSEERGTPKTEGKRGTDVCFFWGWFWGTFYPLPDAPARPGQDEGPKVAGSDRAGMRGVVWPLAQRWGAGREGKGAQKAAGI